MLALTFENQKLADYWLYTERRPASETATEFVLLSFQLL